MNNRNDERGRMPCVEATVAPSPLAQPPAHFSERATESTGQKIRSVHPNFAIQRLTRERPVAPLMPKPIVPFHKSERKRALTTAAYYSECCMHDISPVEADTAALAVQGQYDKWWLGATYSGPDGSGKAAKRRKVVVGGVSTQLEGVKEKRDENYVCVTSEEDSAKTKDAAKTVASEDTAKTAAREDISSTKHMLIAELNATGGDTTTVTFVSILETLSSIYKAQGLDARWAENDSSNMDGIWLTLSKPTWTECQGRNSKGQYIYSLGRLSFDMFRPADLVCSVQGVFNSIRLTDDSDCQRLGSIASRLRKNTVGLPNGTAVRNYDIVVAFTVEANQTRRGTPIKGHEDDEYAVRRPLRSLLTNHGHIVPDPDVPNRVSIWFSGGSLEVQNEAEDLADWKQLFDKNEAPRRAIRELARVLAAKFLLGASTTSEMSDDGTLRYSLRRPIGGHGRVFCDIVYADDTMRILRGHHGSMYVFSKVPSLSNGAKEVSSTRAKLSTAH